MIRVNRLALLTLIALGVLLYLYVFTGFLNKSSPNDPEDMHLLNTLLLQHSKGFSTFSNGKVTLKALLQASISAAEAGGLEVVAVRNSATVLQETIKGKTKEGLKDSATEGDFRSHKVMYYGLRKAFPEVKVISEEHTDTPSDISEVPPSSLTSPLSPEVSLHMQGDETLNAEDVSVWIDPLDATKEFTENLVQYVTTMVGVAVRGKPVLGVVHRPFTKETFWGVVGHGNSPNLDNREAGGDRKLRVIVSRSHAGNVANFTKSFDVVAAAGAGYKVIQVIQNRADAYLHVTAIKKWDLCAGHALLSALGGTMATINGEEIDYSGHTDPLNTKGILAYMKSSDDVEKLKLIQIKE